MGVVALLGAGFTVIERQYREGTNILENRFEFSDATVVLTDFMPVKMIRDIGNPGPDTESSNQDVRILRCTRGRVTATVRVEPGFDWARRSTTPQIIDGIAS